MSTEEATVSHVRDNGQKLQWAQGLFYRRDGRKLTAIPRAFMWATAALFMVGVVISLVSAGSEPLLRSPRFADVSMGGTNAISIRDALAVKRSHSTTESAAAGAEKPARQQKLRPLQRFLRPGSTDIPPGSLFQARLLSGASDGPVRAEVTEPLRIEGETRVESGTMLVGVGQSGDSRLYIRFSQLVAKDGSVREIQAQACDVADQAVGLKGSQVGSYALKLGAVAALNFAGGVSEGLQESKGEQGVEVRKASTKNALLNGAARAALEQAKETLSSAKSEPTVFEVPAGTEICVLAVGG